MKLLFVRLDLIPRPRHATSKFGILDGLSLDQYELELITQALEGRRQPERSRLPER